jgi:CBS domain-containing protein
VTAYKYCQTNVLSVKPDSTVGFVASLMKGKNIGCVVVVDDHKPVGIVTDRDLALQLDEISGKAGDVLIESVMTRDLVTIKKETGIFDAIQEMKNAGVRRMPIVDNGGRLVGLLTVDDLIRLLSREMADIARIIGKEGPSI